MDKRIAEIEDYIINWANTSNDSEAIIFSNKNSKAEDARLIPIFFKLEREIREEQGVKVQIIKIYESCMVSPTDFSQGQLIGEVKVV